MPYDDRCRCGYMFNEQALFFQGVFAMHESGHLEHETCRGYLTWFVCNVATPGGQHWWEQIGRPIFTRRMVAAVDAALKAGAARKFPGFSPIDAVGWMSPGPDIAAACFDVLRVPGEPVEARSL
jgi:hypothetical protein